MSEKLPSYGGQALIEGVMMRGSKAAAMAVRLPDGKIQLHTEALGGIYTSRIGKIPFLPRADFTVGFPRTWDAFLTMSANAQTGEDVKVEGPAMYLTMGFSLLIAVGVFFLAPAALGQLAERWLGINAWWSNLLEGIIRFFLMVGYIWVVGFMPDIRRVFSYHGAEHKTINAFEDGVQMTPENVARYSVEHPRCGTAFLLTLVVLSVILFTLMGPLPFFWRLLTRILLIPVLAGLAYEFIRWTSRHLNVPFVRAIIRPNLALQRLTTREPSPDMLEVSIAALNAMIDLETKPSESS